jgi:thiamine-phosphate pyrophosphorylase
LTIVLSRVYPIVDSAAWVRRLLAVGARLTQLRVKERPTEQIRQEIRNAKTFSAHYNAQLVVNDYWEIAVEEGCDCVHLGQTDLGSADIPALRRAGVRFGISTHDSSELERGLALKPDYVALGPIYPTLLKAMPWPPQGLGRITEWKRRIGTTPLVAIGGLTVDRLAGVFEAGADSAAVVSDVVKHADPDARMADWLAKAEAV